jgi:hypothetical protein
MIPTVKAPKEILLRLVSILTACVLPGCHGGTVDSSFSELNERLEKAQGAPPCPLALTSQVNGSADALTISFNLTNVGPAPMVAQDWELPWGNVHSLQFVVFNSRALVVPLNEAIDDPMESQKSELAPGATIHGEYHLCATSMCQEAKKDRLTVLWSYRAPGTAANRPLCTGIILIPKQR